MKNNEGYMEIDLLRLVYALMQKAVAIILATAILGACAFCYTMFLVKPEYKSTTLLYVNNSSASNGSPNRISSGDLAVSMKLVDTYIVILQSRSTLEEIQREADVPYSVGQLSGMITARAVNETEVFQVNVVCNDAADAQHIADTVGRVLPEKISAIVDGSSVSVVDAASTAFRCGPNVMKNTVLGALLGFVLACAVVVIRELMDKQIHDTDYLLQNYDIPVLAVIPDLSSGMKNKSVDKKKLGGE